MNGDESALVGHTETRMIAMGSSALTQGFGLVGFETWPDARPDDVERVLGELMGSSERAVIFLEAYLAGCDCPNLNRVRAEGGRIVVTEIPQLHAPQEYHPEVEDLVSNVLGAHVLQDTESSWRKKKSQS